MTDAREAADKFFAFSDAYLMAATSLLDRALTTEVTDLNAVGSAIMFNARLGVELFLKGAIVLRNPSATLIGHALEVHRDAYEKLFPEEQFTWNVPFTVQFIGGSDEERARAQTKNSSTRPLDQIFRYPLNTKGQPWETLQNFSPKQFNDTLRRIVSDTSRLTEIIKNICIQEPSSIVEPDAVGPT